MNKSKRHTDFRITILHLPRALWGIHHQTGLKAKVVRPSIRKNQIASIIAFFCESGKK